MEKEGFFGSSDAEPVHFFVLLLFFGRLRAPATDIELTDRIFFTFFSRLKLFCFMFT